MKAYYLTFEIYNVIIVIFTIINKNQKTIISIIVIIYILNEKLFCVNEKSTKKSFISRFNKTKLFNEKFKKKSLNNFLLFNQTSYNKSKLFV